MKLGYIGLGRMGKNMVLRLLEQGIEVVAWNRSPEPREEVKKVGAEIVENLEELVKRLRDKETKRKSDEEKKRQSDEGVIIWLMLPAGDTTDEFIDKLIPLLGIGDLIVDGANSFYKDTLRRAKKLAKVGIEFMDIGVSGGPGGARNGACLMIGGSKENYQRVLKIVKAASAPEAYGHFGPVGSGHFAKMVHNGIEYGMMEAIAEGFAILKNSQFKLDLVEIARIYNNGSVVESRLVGWTKNALEEDPDLADTSSVIGHTGEGEWTIQTAKEQKIDIPVLEDSFRVRLESEKIEETSPEGYRNKVVSAMRGQFGQHAVKKT